MPNPEHQSQPKHKTNEAEASGLKVGDPVAYSRAFLRSISAFTGDLPHAKGQITGMKTIGRDLVLADVAWDKAELPARVNVKNLCRIGSRAYHE